MEESDTSTRELPATLTPQRNIQCHDAGDIEVKLAAWMLEFSTLQITMLPNRVSPNTACGSAHPNQNPPRCNIFTPLPTPCTQPSRHTPHEHSQGSPTVLQTDHIPAAGPMFPSPRAAPMQHQYRHQPIYPLEEGEQALHGHIFDSHRAHGTWVLRCICWTRPRHLS